MSLTVLPLLGRSFWYARARLSVQVITVLHTELD